MSLKVSRKLIYTAFSLQNTAYQIVAFLEVLQLSVIRTEETFVDVYFRLLGKCLCDLLDNGTNYNAILFPSLANDFQNFRFKMDELGTDNSAPLAILFHNRLCYQFISHLSAPS